MKRLLSLAGFAVILSLIPLTSVWAVWEGNAGIGQASDFPGSGLYAKSDMFPKNTVVEIKNLETEKSVRAVITGSSGVPGLVAVLSPETASALSIKAGSVCRVRIYIPSITERPAEGTAVDGTKPTNADPDANPAAAVNQTKNTEVPLETIAESPKDPLVALAPAESTATAPAPVESLTAAPSPASSDVPAEPVASSTSSSPISSETAKGASPSAAASEPVPPAEAAEAESVVAVAPAAGTTPTAEAVTDTGSTGRPVAEPELAVVPDSAADNGSESEIALVPAEPLPPSAPASAKNDVPVVDAPAPVPPSSAVASEVDVPEVTPVDKPSKVTPVPTQQAVAPAPAPVAKPPVVAPVAANPSDVPVVSSLAKGSYYVQIGTYGDMGNVKKIIETYGSKYPFAVEKAPSKKGETLKVYVGPVKKDEYGAVLERFRQLGFKDAYVRKVQ